MTISILEKPQSSFELTQKNQPLHDSVRQSVGKLFDPVKRSDAEQFI